MAFSDSWWIVGAALIAILYAIGHYLCQLVDLSRVGLYEIDRMQKADFQRFCHLLLKKAGYRVARPRRHQQWVSFILEKDGERTALIVKQYTGQVNTRPVERVVKAAAKNNCERAIVLTNRAYSSEARRRARELQVELWDRDKLADLIIVARTR